MLIPAYLYIKYDIYVLLGIYIAVLLEKLSEDLGHSERAYACTKIMLLFNCRYHRYFCLYFNESQVRTISIYCISSFMNLVIIMIK